MRCLTLLLILIAGTIHAQPSAKLTPEAAEAYQLVLSLRFEEATEKMEAALTSDPQNVVYMYLDNYIDFLSAFISENDKAYNTLLDNKDVRLDWCEKLSDKNPYKNYLIANINLQVAMARLKFGEYLKAALEVNRAYRKISQNREEFPDFFPNQITLGVLHAIIGVVPENYQWLLDIVSMSGNVEQGRQELMNASTLCKTTHEFEAMDHEIQFYLGFINLNLYHDNQINPLFGQLNDNLLLKYLTINILMKNGQNKEALMSFSQINDTIPYYPFYYLDYLHGECYLRTLMYQEAIEQYELFTKYFKGKNYLKDAKRKQAWCWLLQGDTRQYVETISQLGNMGAIEVGIDREAETEMISKSIPNTYLLKSRLLFDGGYYSEAIKLLNTPSKSSLTPAEQVEIQYRLARIADKTSQFEEAKTAYLKTIELGRNMDLYFAANSALMLGNIYYDEGANEAARKMYQLCLELDFTTYRSSIRGKAKQQLSMLE